MKTLGVSTLIAACAVLNAAASESFFDFSSLTLVDAVDCATDSTHDFVEFSNSISQVETVLGSPVRSLPNATGEMKYFGYRLGAGKGLQADKGYVLRIIYPEDQPRSMFILNRGCETMRGFHTGRTTGDGIEVPYVNNNAESLELPLSGQMESWNMLFYLQERFPGLQQPRGTSYPRDETPEDGFLVLCVQLSPENDPLSAGVAVHRIELYEAPPLEELRQTVPDLPPGLPKRHLFWREEMADGVISSTNPDDRGYADDMSWYEQKFRLMQFLGMRTFSKDLLEFGANQGWDSSKYGGNSWVYQSSFPARWSRIVRRCGELGFDVMPYYEYAGSKGSSGLGFEKRAEPLNSGTIYTHVTWAETANADLTDPDTFEDLRKMLEITIADEQENADFAGAWIRTRVSDLPISFSDATRARFEADTAYENVTRDRLNAEPDLYAEYIDWWYARRHDFLEQVRDYLRSEIHPDMDLLFTADSSEPGKSRLSPHNSDVVAENPAAWNSTTASVKALADAVEENWQLQTLTNDWATWSYYEWHHAVPHPDPVRYTNSAGLYMTETVNRAYTLEPDVMQAFRARDGLAAIRHYSLNEDATKVDGDPYLLGYFVADVDYAGPFVMLPEALAFAHGDPRYFGYLASNNFNRGNPYYVRRFNANYLALPALSSTADPAYCADTNLVVRKFDTPSNGIYLGAVNLARTNSTFTLTLPETGHLLDAVTGQTLARSETNLVLEMAPCELRSFRYFPDSSNTPPEVRINESISLEWFRALEERGAWLLTELNPEVVDFDTGDEVASASWSVTAGAEEAVQIQYADAAKTKVAFSSPGTFELTLSVSDGTAVRHQTVTVEVATRRNRIPLKPEMADYTGTNIKDSGLFNNQEAAGDPPSGDLGATWTTTGASMYPVSFIVDMEEEYHISEIWLLDYNGIGTFKVYTGSEAEGWTNVVSFSTDKYKVWRRFDTDQISRYLKIERVDGGATIGEMVLFGRGGGSVTPGSLSPLPQQPRIKQDGAQLHIHFHANPMHTYEMDHSINLTNWTTVGTWDDSDPFPFHSQIISNRGYFKLKETAPSL